MFPGAAYQTARCPDVLATTQLSCGGLPASTGAVRWCVAALVTVCPSLQMSERYFVGCSHLVQPSGHIPVTALLPCPLEHTCCAPVGRQAGLSLEWGHLCSCRRRWAPADSAASWQCSGRQTRVTVKVGPWLPFIAALVCLLQHCQVHLLSCSLACGWVGSECTSQHPSGHNLRQHLHL